MAFNTYNKEASQFEIDCHNVIADSLKHFTIKYLNENGESYGFDAMLYTPNRIEIPLEYECCLEWYGDTYPKHWKYTKWIKNKADTKYHKFKNGDWKYGFYLKFNRNCSLFYIASFDKIINYPIDSHVAYRNGAYHNVEHYSIPKEQMFLFHVEDFENVMLNISNPEALDKLRIK